MNSEIKERAYNKARSKINGLNREFLYYVNQLTTNTTQLDKDTLYKMIDSTERELLTWKYILILIQSDDSVI